MHTTGTTDAPGRAARLIAGALACNVLSQPLDAQRQVAVAGAAPTSSTGASGMVRGVVIDDGRADGLPRVAVVLLDAAGEP